MSLRTIVIGSGLVGLSSAHFLQRRGHDVLVLDRAEGPGLQTSFANGSILTPSMPEPWNAPGCWRVLLASLARSDAPLQLRFRQLPSLAGWGIKFLRSSSPKAYTRNTLSNLRLALYSLEVMERLRGETGVDYDRSARGTLRVFRDAAALEAASAGAERLVSEGLPYLPLSTAQTIALEPALAPIAGQLAGAIHYPVDETGNAYRFCVALADYLRTQGVDFRFRTDVSRIETAAGRVSAVVAGSERLVADRYVVAAGSFTTPLLKRIGVLVPVRPAKGYSVTFDRSAINTTLRIPVVDDALHAVVVPLSHAVRVAGTAEFAGFDYSLPSARIRNLTTLLKRVLPNVPFDPQAAKPWCGLRPMAADGVPIIGKTALPNLFVNTGHGHLGWTMAAGSGKLLADVMSGESPEISPDPFALSRFVR